MFIKQFIPMISHANQKTYKKKKTKTMEKKGKIAFLWFQISPIEEFNNGKKNVGWLTKRRVKYSKN